MKEDLRTKFLKDGEIIPISFDYHFVRIFGENNNMDIIEYFISDYYSIPIEKVAGNIEILSGDLPQDSKREKSKQVDLLLKMGNKNINIEISNTTSPGRRERDLVYLSKIHGEQLKYKAKYEDIGYSWQIRFNNISCNDGKLIKTYYLTSDDEERNIYSEKFRIDDIDLVAAKKIEYNEDNEKLLRWCRILTAKSREEIVLEIGDKLMDKDSREKLLKEVEKNSSDKEIYDIYEKYSTFEMERADELSNMLKKNTKDNAIKTAKRMLEKKMDIKDILDVTDLSEEELNNLIYKSNG